MGNDNLVFDGEGKEHHLSHTWSREHTATIQENIIILVMLYHHLFHERYSLEIEQTKNRYYQLLRAEELCRDVKVIDLFCCDISYNDKFWADMTHLNSAGAEEISLSLEKEFEKIYY